MNKIRLVCESMFFVDPGFVLNLCQQFYTHWSLHLLHQSMHKAIVKTAEMSVHPWLLNEYWKRQIEPFIYLYDDDDDHISEITYGSPLLDSLARVSIEYLRIKINKCLTFTIVVDKHILYSNSTHSFIYFDIFNEHQQHTHKQDN